MTDLLCRLNHTPIQFLVKVAKSQKVLHFGSNLKKKVPNYNPEHLALLFRWIVLRVVIFVTLWGDISAKSEKLSKIKPPFAVLNYNVA